MDREILFRGKRIDNNQWVYGGISVFKGCVDIFDQNTIDNSCEQVFDYTVGQFTGLTDKNGVKIFEGDIVRILYTDWPSKSDNDNRTLDQYLNDIAKIGKIVCDVFQFGIAIYSDKFNEDIVHSPEHGQYGFIEVIGNIHDNTK